MCRRPSSSFLICYYDGIAEIVTDESTEIFQWAKIIAAKKKWDNDKTENMTSSERELLRKIKPTKVIRQKDIVG